MRTTREQLEWAEQVLAQAQTAATVAQWNEAQSLTALGEAIVHLAAAAHTVATDEKLTFEDLYAGGES